MTRWIVQLQRFVALGELGTTYLLPALLINVGNAAAYLFQVVLGRTLSIADFGAFNASFSALLILTAPANFLPLLVAESAMATRSPGEARRLLSVSIAGALMLAAALSGIGLLLVSLYGARFDLSVGTALAGLTVTVFSCLHPVAVGMIQMRRRYVPAALVVGGNPLLRLAIGLVLIAGLGLGRDGAMWSVALPVALTFLLGLFFLRDLFGVTAEPLGIAARAVIRHAGWRQALTVTLLTVISNLDVVIARLALPEADAGLYAGAAVVSRICLLLPSALATIIFTEAAHAKAGGDRQRMLHGLLVTAGFAGATGLLFLAAGDPIMRVMLGRDFAASGEILRLTSLAMSIFAVAQGAVMMLAGRGRFGYLGLLVLAGAALAAAPLFLTLSAEGLAAILLGVNAALLLSVVVLLLRRG